MDRHEIPTHLNVEDKAFAGLTMRQLMTAAVGLGLAYGAVSEPPFPLVGIVCRNQGEFARFSAAQGVSALSGLLGFRSVGKILITAYVTSAASPTIATM